MAFSPDSRLFAAARRMGIINLLQAETMREIIGDRRFVNEASSVTFSPDGHRLAAGGAGMESIKIWDVDSHQELLTLAARGGRDAVIQLSRQTEIL